MIRLVVSNRPEELRDALVANLRAERAAGSPFDPACVVVPNRNVETWLKLGIAAQAGIAANIEILFLKKLMARVVRGALPALRVVEGRHMQGFLLALLHDDALLGEPVMAPVRAYLDAAGRHADAIDRRRCQLAAQLAHLFEEYGWSRAAMLEGWDKGGDEASVAAPGDGGGSRTNDHARPGADTDRDTDRDHDTDRDTDRDHDTDTDTDTDRDHDGDGDRDGDDAGATEAWQRRLWRAAFADGGLASRRPPHDGAGSAPAQDTRGATTRGDAGVGAGAAGVTPLSADAGAAPRWAPWPRVLRALRTAPLTGAPPSLHVFGISHMARGFHDLVAALGREGVVHVYALNPCRETRDDLDRAAERRLAAGKDGKRWPTRAGALQGSLELPGDPTGLRVRGDMPLLPLWAAPPRENLSLLLGRPGVAIEPRYRDVAPAPPAPPAAATARPGRGKDDASTTAAASAAPGPRAAAASTLLGRLQQDLVDRVRERDAPDPSLRADDSLRILRCPGVRRELETIAADVWRRLGEDDTLRASDIAVVVPPAQKDLYLAHASSVFGEAFELPHHVVDLPASAGSRIGQAVTMLLALPLGSFTRREMLPLLTQPSLMARFPDAQVTDWAALPEALGIVRGADRAALAGSYVEQDLFTWDQGVRRLALGALVPGARSGESRPVTFGADDYLPVELPADRRDGALGFALLARSLLADARFARDERLELPQWLRFMAAWVTTTVAPLDDDDERVLGRLLSALHELEDVDMGGLRVSYRVAHELASGALDGIEASRGQYLADGVSVASFVPMRAIPFRVLYVAGLNQGAFPAPARRSRLDLRGSGRRQPGDVTPREQDKALFLETLLCARDALVLSYVARDPLTGGELLPSSVVVELRETLRRGYLGRDELTKLDGGAPVPLRRHHDDAACGALPGAAMERVADRVGRTLGERLSPEVQTPSLADLERDLPGDAWRALQARFAIVRPPPIGAAAARPERITVPLGAILRFLDCPLQGSAAFGLRLRAGDDGPDEAEREDEAFESEMWPGLSLAREAMAAAVLAHGAAAPDRALEAAYDALARARELDGQSPTGLFGVGQRRALVDVLRHWRDLLGQGLAAGRTAAGAHAEGAATACIQRFGRAQEHAPAGTKPLDAILLSLPPAEPGAPPRQVEIVGQTQLLVRAGDHDVSLVLTKRTVDDAGRLGRDHMRAFLDHVVLSATGLSVGPHAGLVLRAGNDGKGAANPRRFRPITRDAARAWLTDVVHDMSEGLFPHLLPCEAVMDVAAVPDAAAKPDAPAAPLPDARAIVETVEAKRDLWLEDPKRAFSSTYGPVPNAPMRLDPPPLDLVAAIVERRFKLFFDSAIREGGGGDGSDGSDGAGHRSDGGTGGGPSGAETQAAAATKPKGKGKRRGAAKAAS